ncbi:MAG: hypothetical protein NT069_10140 [Planctomycetota bacterium]|nr:hypothetical protein [Planctomycetota bacterium]
MNADDSLVQLKRLLLLLPGVELAWLQSRRSVARIGLAVTDLHSLAILAHVSRDANVELCVEVDWSCTGKPDDDPNCVRYDLRLPIESAPYLPPSKVQMVGGFLAKKLRKRGLLPAGEADQLLLEWGFGVAESTAGESIEPFGDVDRSE